jgi:hypothetical protein
VLITNRLNIFFICLAATWLISCAPVKPYILSDLQRDPQFVLIEMLASGLVLGGVTVTAFPASVEERNAITAQLEDVLTQFSFYKVLTPPTLSKRVSQEKYEKILEFFEKHRTIPADELKNLKTIYTPARYILFVNIDSNTVSQRKNYHPDSIEFQSVRTIVATLNIMSMETEQPALYTRIAYSDVNSTSMQRMRGGAGVSLFGGVMSQVTFGGFPEPPTTEHTLYRVFLAVADLIPSN